MLILVSEDLNASARDPYRFCAGIEGGELGDRVGFGSTEEQALATLAAVTELDLSSAEIERFGVR